MLSIENLCLAYGDQTVVTGATLSLEPGEIGCLLGPSGCGKSTLLRGIAGFERPARGAVSLEGRPLSAPSAVVEPEKRRIGMVFQDFALFPHLDVARNIAFGLKGADRRERRRRVGELLELFGMTGYEKRMPHSLSGGEQQRVALARAMAPKPKLLLMDEAFSSLDAELRLSIVPEVRKILKHENMSAILVTHDQAEAFALADRVGVMNAGRIHQWDDPRDLYHRPATKFVARFVGEGELIEATSVDRTKLRSALGIHNVHQDHHIEVGRDVEILVRPDDVLHDRAGELIGAIVQISFRGSHYQYLARLENGQCVYCLAASHEKHEIGERIGLMPKLEHLVVFGRDESSVVYDSTLDTFLKTLSVAPFASFARVR